MLHARPGGRSRARGRCPGGGASWRRGRTGRTRRAGPPGRSRCRGRAPGRLVVDDHLDDPAGGGVVGRVVEQVVDRAGEPLGTPVDDHRLERALEPDVGEVAARARQAIGDDAIEPDVLGRGDRKVAAGKLDHVADQRAELLALLEDVGEQPVAVVLGERVAGEQHLDVRAQARDRSAQLVRGVGNELALGPDGLVERGAGALQSLDHRVEARGELADLVVGVVLDPARQVLGVGDVLGGLRRPRPAARARVGPPGGRGTAASAIPPGAQQEQDQRAARRGRCRRGASGRASCKAAGLGWPNPPMTLTGSVSSRRTVPPTVTSWR